MLQGLPVNHTAVVISENDAACQDASNGGLVKGGEKGSEMIGCFCLLSN